MKNTAEASVLFKHNYASTAHVVVNQGGTSSGKTYAIEQVLFCKACEAEKQVITVVAQDVPNLKAGALRDALNIFNGSEEFKSAVKSFNKTDRIFEFHNGSIIEFKSYGDAQDAKSGKRDYLFINEANGITWPIYTELSLRTKKQIFIDYNPNTAFWVHDNVLGREGVELIISDHRHNPFLDDLMRKKIESHKEEDVERWKVYARGLTGKVSGMVLTNWLLCDGIPPDARLVAAGLDFGFTNDETGCLVVYQSGGALWINELLYETRLTNMDISWRLTEAGLSKNTEIIADSAEPKSIEELRRLGWRVSGAKKGADSIKHSIDLLKRYNLNITRNSVNLRKELERYKWRTDSSGKALNEPIERWNHLIDSLRYVALNKLKVTHTSRPKSRLPFKAESLSSNTFNQMLSI